MSKIFDINGKKVNLGKAIPLRIGDWRTIKEEHDIDPTNLTKVMEDFNQLVKLCTYVIQKANPEVTPDDIDTMTFDNLFEMFTSTTNAGSTDRPS